MSIERSSQRRRGRQMGKLVVWKRGVTKFNEIVVVTQRRFTTVDPQQK